jgi:hypothetical protein
MLFIAFLALGVECGRWYAVRAELSKSVDAASLVAAKNISNPFVSPTTLAIEFGQANFPSGFLGTGTAGGAATFTAQMLDNNKVQVNGTATAVAFMRPFFWYNFIPISSSGVAQKKEVEIVVVLDRSYSMVGRPMTSLKHAANLFVSNFQATQDKDKVGLITFASSVKVDVPMGNNYVTAMRAAINGMGALGGTNAEDAIDQSDGPQGFTDQTGMPGDQRVQQFLIFFSDGQPTAFRGSFLQAGTTYDGVAGIAGGNCVPGDMGTNVYDGLYKPAGPEGQMLAAASTLPTGNGVVSANCGGASPSGQTTRWYIFDTDPVPGYAATQSCIPTNRLLPHVCTVCAGLALEHGQELKDKGIMIYTIGLGADNATFLRSLASAPDMYSSTPDDTELDALFEKVAKEIRLRLVQ